MLAIETRLDKIFKTLRDFSRSTNNEENFHWQNCLRLDDLYYPQFMQISLEPPEVYRDLDHKGVFKVLCERNIHQSKIVKLITGDDQEKYFPTKWSLKALNDRLTEASKTSARMHIRDFPSGEIFGLVPSEGAAGSDVDVPGGVSQLLKDSV